MLSNDLGLVLQNLSGGKLESQFGIFTQFEWSGAWNWVDKASCRHFHLSFVVVGDHDGRRCGWIQHQSGGWRWRLNCWWLGNGLLLLLLLIFQFEFVDGLHHVVSKSLQCGIGIVVMNHSKWREKNEECKSIESTNYWSTHATLTAKRLEIQVPNTILSYFSS